MTKSRPRTWGRAWFVPALIAALASCSQDAPEDRPNILLISIDSLRADHLKCYGYDRATSPTLDEIAAEGVRFERLVAESSWTLPTHMTMMTGLSSVVHGVSRDSNLLPPSRTTLAEALRAHGYRTRGLWSGTYLHPIFGFGQGFEEGDYEGVIGDLVFDRPKLDPQDPRFAEKRFEDMKTATSAVTTPTIVAKAIEFLEGRPSTEAAPFFLFLHLFDVHFDYNPPEACWREFDPDYDGTLDTANFPFNPAIHAGMDPRELRHVIARYDGEILFVNRQLKRLFIALERLGLKDDTIVVITGDHGDEFFEHGDKGHQKTLFDEVLLVPWIVRLPGGVGAGRVIREQARHLDIMPTILGLVGLASPPEVMGEDLSKVIRGERAPRDLSAVSRLETPRLPTTTSLRTPAWKLITRAGGDPADRVSLYDLKEDPGEHHPLRDVDRLREPLQRLQDWSRVEAMVRRATSTEEGAEVELPEDLRKQLDELGY